MNPHKTRSFDAAGLVLVAILFVALVMLSNALFRGIRLDLTENKLYTISEGTRSILDNIEEPITLYFFYSDRATRNIQTLRTYATRVRELLQEFVQHSDGMLKLVVTDPLPFSEEEDQAAQLGLQAINLPGSVDPVYFGLAATNAVDDVEVIPFFQPDKEGFLEYELAKLVDTLANPVRPVIGLMSTLPMDVGFDPATRQMREAWIITSQLRQLFDLRSIPVTATEIEEDVELLMLVHPKGLSESTLYAIDQFVMRGGKALMFIDPYAEAESQPQDQSNPFPAMGGDKSSDPGPLLAAWGIDLKTRQIVGDAKQALMLGTGSGRPIRHVGIIGILEDNLNDSDVVTSGLSEITVASAGMIKKQEGAEVSLEALMTSSSQAMPIPIERILFLPNPSTLLDGFASTGEQYVIAARITGELESAFPNGAPDTEGTEAAGGDKGSSHLKSSNGPVNLIVVADTDILTDRLWVQVQRFFGQQIANAFANNGDFVINALDNLSGSNDLISIRGRATYSRPFTTVQELERRADERFRATEQRLQQQLDDTERKLAELESQKQEGSSLILSPEQRAEVERFLQEKVRIRKELRQVRRDLDRNIEQLGTWLKVINIGLVPALISLVAIFMLVTARLRGRQRSVQHEG